MPSRTLVGAALDGDDPLAESIRCISFDSTGSDDGLKGQLNDILERFQKDQRYRNDERYLKLWMRYADLTDDADKVFQMLKSEGIGAQLALFWAAWAYVLEMAESYSRAAERIAEGRARGAVPVSLLEDFLGAFHRRMLERMRVAGLDDPPRSFLETDETSETNETVEDEGNVTESLRSVVDAKSNPSCEVVKSIQPEREHARRTCRSELSKGAEKKSTGGADTASADKTTCTLGTGILKSVGSPLGDRDVNSRDSQAQPGYRGYTARSRGERVSRTPTQSDNAVTLIHDPFSLDTRRRLTTDTARYKRWVSSSSVVHDVRVDCLARRWPRKMAKVKVGSRRPAVLTRMLGSQQMDVLGVLGEGAFAVIFSCKISEGQRRVAVKIERQEDAASLPWECFITLQLGERLLCRRREKINSYIQPVVVLPEALYLYRDGCAMTMPHGSCGTLHDLVALYAQKAKTMPQVVAMHYAVEMLRFCRAMHSVSILHMDIKPDNWLLTPRPGSEAKSAGGIARARPMEHSLSLIDFGRAIDLSVFPRQGSGTAFKGHCCASSFACPAMVEGREWKHDADLFALGSCMYFMLHGVYLEVSCEHDARSTFSSSGRRWRPVNRCKRYWEVDLWDNLFDMLLNADSRATDTAGTDIILSRLEDSLASYLNSDQSSRELQECLRRQDSMFSDR